MNLLKFIFKIFGCVLMISFYLCMIMIIIPVNFIYLCVMTTYYMFEYKTMNIVVINEHLSNKVSGMKKGGKQ